MADGPADKSYRKRMLGNRTLAPETLMMSYGYDPRFSEGAIKPPVFLTSTFLFKSAQDGKDFFALTGGRRERRAGEEPGLIYSRFNNPDLEMLEDRLAIYDEAEASLVCASGMAAISTAMWGVLRPGDVLVVADPIYGGTDTLVRKVLPQFGIEMTSFLLEEGQAGLNRAIAEAKTKGRVSAIFIETPANPTCGIFDLSLARAASETLTDARGRPPVMVDNTMLGPLFQHPTRFGADLVCTSLTKYVGGHSDLIAGSVSGGKVYVDKARAMRNTLGTMLDPHTCWLLMRSLETLKLRMTAAAEGAKKVAAFLRDHPKVGFVWFLDFLPDGHPDRAVYLKQCDSAGSTFSFDVKGGEAEAFRLLDNLKLIKLAVSLGGTETLAQHPAAMTHSGVSPENRAKFGISDAMIRISIGIEHPDDLIADLDQALSYV